MENGLLIKAEQLNRKMVTFLLYKNIFLSPRFFLKKRRGYCNRLCPSLRPSVGLSVMLSPPKPLDEIQPNLVCELLT